MTDFKEKRLWHKRHHDFLIEVSQHQVEDRIRGRGKHRWCVYAYVYPTHPRFASIKEGAGIFQDAFQDLPLHWGCTKFETHRVNSQEVTSYKFGADYDHLYDWDFCSMENEREAAIVFVDAEELFNFLKAESEATIARAACVD